MKEAATVSNPIIVNAKPETQKDALANLLAFVGSREQRLADSADNRAVSSISRIKKCFGWLTVHGTLFRGMSLELRLPVITVGKVTRFMSYDQEHIAIVDEFVENGENDPEVVQEGLEFLQLGGFAHTLSPAARNWKSGILMDRGDIIHPGDYGWKKQLYTAVTARRVLKPQLTSSRHRPSEF